MGLFIGFTYSGVLVFIPIELNSMGAGIRGSAFCYLCFDDYNQSTFGGESVCSLWIQVHYLSWVRLIYIRPIWLRALPQHQWLLFLQLHYWG